MHIQVYQSYCKTEKEKKNKKSICPIRSLFSYIAIFYVMHVEKNACEKVICIVLDIIGKTKDNLKARLDIKSLGIRPSLYQNTD